MLKEQLDQKIECRNLLYRRGYLITERCDLNLSVYPFYDNWTINSITDRFNLYLHKEQHFYSQTESGVTALLIGHAYNPFTMEFDENIILKDCIHAYINGDSDFFDKVSELTGIHLIAIFDKDIVLIVQDCSGVQMCCYGKCNDHTYITSNCTIVEDIDTPTANKFANDLLNSKSFKH